MQSISFSLHLQWKIQNPSHSLSPKLNLCKPKTLTFSHSLRTSYKGTNNEEGPTKFYLPIEVQKGRTSSRYFWNGSRLELVDFDDKSEIWVGLDEGFAKIYHSCRCAFWGFLIPNQVQGNYIEYVKWKFLHRLFSSALQVLATQAMFRAMGVGFSQSLPSAAALNWVLKDGLGRLSRCIYTSCLASAFDINLKRVRFSTAVLFSLSLGVELLTPFFPRHFLLIATVANIAKQISLACYISTRSTVHRSFAVADNLGEISAKAQIQTVCFDSLGLILAAFLNLLCKNNQRLQAALPLLIYPIFSALDLLGIYQGLKHIHLQTLTKGRLEIILDTWIQSGSVPSPSMVSQEEGIGFPWSKDRKQWPIRIGCVDPKDSITKFSVMTMQSLRSKDFYFICMEASNRDFTGNCQLGIVLSLHKEASTSHIIMGLLQTCHVRRILVEKKKRWEHILKSNDISESVLSEWVEVVDDSKRCAQREVNVLNEIKLLGWALKNVLLSAEEQVRYNFLDDSRIGTPAIKLGA